MRIGKKGLICLFGFGVAVMVAVAGLIVKGEPVMAGSFSDITSDSIEAKKDEIANATTQQNNINNSISDMKTIISGLKAKKSDLNKYIAEIDSTMSGLQSKITAFEELILQKEAEIVLKEQELEEALAVDKKTENKTKDWSASAEEARKEMLANRQFTIEEVKAQYTKEDDRLTKIVPEMGDIDLRAVTPNLPTVITLSHRGYVKRTKLSDYRAQARGGTGFTGVKIKDADFIERIYVPYAHDDLLFFTNTGRVYRKKGYQIPEAGKTAKGTNIVNILPVENGESVSAMIATRALENEDLFLMMVTRDGTVKRLSVSALRNIRNNGIRALNLDEGDELMAVLETDGSQHILIATRDGYAIRFDENDVRPMGRDAFGVRGIKLREDDCVVGAVLAKDNMNVLTITENGLGKQTPVEEYRITGRGGMGIKNYDVTDKTGRIVGVKLVDGSEDLLAVTEKGIMIRTVVDAIRVTGRVAQGVYVMRFKEEGDRVISIALAEKEQEEESGEPVAAEGENA